MDPQKASMLAAITDGDYSKINITLTNAGTRAATLKNMKIEGTTKQGQLALWFLNSSLDGAILEPGKSYVTVASNVDRIPGIVEPMRSVPLRKMYGFTDNCRLLIEYVDVNGQGFIYPYPFMCDPIDWNYRGGLDESVRRKG
ncbi:MULTISPECIES: hypothetical protein [unclassified Pseudomonas]|uniref:hypothetical protein n=1 Tax=unclassified Pseudomonas TaxID=196821 RepID=UPI0006ACAD23|nr:MULTISPECIES: hypothetical protein [unclassified Pseudomonas]MBD9545245.1 hypothetical protein [Pseudomonas sp. PDM01]